MERHRQDLNKLDQHAGNLAGDNGQVQH